MLVTLPNPFSLDTTAHPLQLQPIKATQLQRADTQTRQGRIIRGRGMARCEDIPGSTNTIIACGVFVRKDCRRVVLTQDSSGTVEIRLGATEGIVGFPCAGPLPAWQDFDVEPGDQLVYINLLSDSNPMFSDWTKATKITAISGHTYKIDCVGRWSADGITYYNADGWTSNCLDGVFVGTPYGKVWAHDPGSTGDLTNIAAWTSIGKNGTITATASGNMWLLFADNIGAYADNVGYMAARARDIT